MEFTNEEYIKNKIFRRERDAHKGNFGKALIFAGSSGMAGAAILCGRAALKGGAGLVRYLIPWRPSETPVMDLCSVLQSTVPEATCVEYYSGMNFSEYSAIAAGPGIGTGAVSVRILKKILRSYNGILVLDADALNIIAKKNLGNEVRYSPAMIIITPHIGEAKRLLGNDSRILTDDERKDAALKLTKAYDCITVLKGAGTLVAAWDSEANDYVIFQNTTGNPGMAAGGSGDVLTGVITSLAAQGYDPLDAARIGVFIHGLAGDICAKEIGEMGMISSDICAAVPKALNEYY